MSEINLTSNSAGVEESSKALSGVNVKTAPVHVGAAEHKEMEQTEAKNVEVGVFMDGTWNNRNNTDARREHERLENGADPKNVNMDLAARYINDDIKSFESEYSNIARMKPYYKEEETEDIIKLAVYIEGVGTENYEKDSTLGGGFGIGGTGIMDKVKKACKKIVKNISKKEAETINLLTIDVFGFSRGAAAARNMVHEVTKPSMDAIYRREAMVRPKQPRYGHLGKGLEEEGISLRMLRVRFVGLYDTVSAHGLGLIADYDNDTETLHLDSVRKAQFTLQLTADDEHRRNFSLINIKSAVSADCGVEYALPGVHADIGGSYNDGQEEGRMFNYGARDFVMEQGWYKPDQITIKTVPRGNYGYSRYIKGTRTLPNTYSRIPLCIMTDIALGKEIPILGVDLKNDFSIPEDLQKVKSRIDDYIFNGGQPLEFSSLEKLKQQLERGQITMPAYRKRLNDSLMLMKLRNEYLHFSARFRDLVNKPRRTFWGGHRKRKINDG